MIPFKAQRETISIRNVYKAELNTFLFQLIEKRDVTPPSKVYNDMIDVFTYKWMHSERKMPCLRIQHFVTIRAQVIRAQSFRVMYKFKWQSRTDILINGTILNARLLRECLLSYGLYRQWQNPNQLWQLLCT